MSLAVALMVTWSFQRNDVPAAGDVIETLGRALDPVTVTERAALVVCAPRPSVARAVIE